MPDGRKAVVGPRPDRHLSATAIRLKSEKRGAIVARWYRSVLEGKEIPMDDVYSWIELSRE
ncbi:MAG: hypothetical protein JJT81_05315 [Rubellimicrobium sp.]|nr:hypothetical protein [Rubellimicrobium sp.]